MLLIFSIINETFTGCVEVITLEAIDDNWYLKTNDNEYLYIPSYGNFLCSGAELNDSYKWNISFDGDYAIIQNIMYPERYIKFNNTNYRL